MGLGVALVGECSGLWGELGCLGGVGGGRVWGMKKRERERKRVEMIRGAARGEEVGGYGEVVGEWMENEYGVGVVRHRNRGRKKR